MMLRRMALLTVLVTGLTLSTGCDLDDIEIDIDGWRPGRVVYDWWYGGDVVIVDDYYYDWWWW